MPFCSVVPGESNKASLTWPQIASTPANNVSYMQNGDVMFCKPDNALGRAILQKTKGAGNRDFPVSLLALYIFTRSVNGPQSLPKSLTDVGKRSLDYLSRRSNQTRNPKAIPASKPSDHVCVLISCHKERFDTPNRTGFAPFCSWPLSTSQRTPCPHHRATLLRRFHW